tara:strand:+ start:216 stop:824 length:609 start_codon:yes stop_codon:yes gene_type:complete
MSSVIRGNDNFDSAKVLDEITVYSGTTTSASGLVNPNGSTGLILYETETLSAGTYTLDNLGDNSPYWSKGSNTYGSFDRTADSSNLLGFSVLYCTFHNNNYYQIYRAITLTSGPNDMVNSLINLQLNATSGGPNQDFVVANNFTIRIVLGTYDVTSNISQTSATTSFGTRGTWKLNSGVSFGFRLTKKQVSPEQTGSGTQYP